MAGCKSNWLASQNISRNRTLKEDKASGWQDEIDQPTGWQFKIDEEKVDKTK